MTKDAAPEASHDFSSEDDTLKNALTHILYHLKDDRKRYSRIFSCESSEIFWSYFREQLSGLMSGFKYEPKTGETDIPEDFRLDFFAGAFIEAVKWWFRTDLETSPEKLVSYFAALTGQDQL